MASTSPSSQDYFTINTYRTIRRARQSLQRKEVLRHNERAHEPSIPLGVVLNSRHILPPGRHLVPQEIPRRLCHEPGLGTMCPQTLDKHPHVVVQPELLDPRFGRASGSATAQQRLATHGRVVPLKGWATGIYLRGQRHVSQSSPSLPRRWSCLESPRT